MSKQKSKSNSKLPNQQIDSLIVGKLNLSAYANKDAVIDGTGSNFQSFYARLIQLAGAVNDKYVADTMEKFRAWSTATSEKFTQMSGDLPGDSQICIDGLRVQTEDNLAGAVATYSQKIIHLEKEKHRWYKRFPELGQNLDEAPQKNVFLLGGLILFLLAAESIANSRFFAEGSELGLLGGTLEAITVSLGNVFIPLGLAFFGHRWFHRYDFSRVFGIVMIGLFLLWAFGFNHLVAQYRESLIVATGTGSSDSGILNYALLFALGVAVAGISFWKTWSFLDPFKQARKCLHDLDLAKEKFKETVCADLNLAQTKYNEIRTTIKKMETQIPAEFRKNEAEFKRVCGQVIEETKKVFADYHIQYCVMKVDPDPLRPVVMPTREPPPSEKNEGKADITNSGGFPYAEWTSVSADGTTETHPVGIPLAEWEHFHDMKALLDGQIRTATDEWIPRLHDILAKIIDLINKFQNVIIAKLLKWETDALSA